MGVFLAYVVLLCYYGYYVLKEGSTDLNKKRSVREPLVIACLSFVTFSTYFWSGEMGLCHVAERGSLGFGGRTFWRLGMHMGWHAASPLAGHAAIQALVAGSVKDQNRLVIDWAIIPYVVCRGNDE